MKRRSWCLMLLAAPLAAMAQTAPRADEKARFGPLHAAAQRGDLAALKRALADGVGVDSRDGHGRTAVHVATFARQRDAIRVLAEHKANLGLLENDRYDAVTIAAVADDEDTLRLLLQLN